MFHFVHFGPQAFLKINAPEPARTRPFHFFICFSCTQFQSAFCTFSFSSEESKPHITIVLKHNDDNDVVDATQQMFPSSYVRSKQIK